MSWALLQQPSLYGTCSNPLLPPLLGYLLRIKIFSCFRPPATSALTGREITATPVITRRYLQAQLEPMTKPSLIPQQRFSKPQPEPTSLSMSTTLPRQRRMYRHIHAYAHVPLTSARRLSFARVWRVPLRYVGGKEILHTDHDAPIPPLPVTPFGYLLLPFLLWDPIPFVHESPHIRLNRHAAASIKST